MNTPAIGLWIDDRPVTVLTNRYFELLAEHGVSTIAVMLESVGGGFDPRWTIDGLLRLGGLARHHDIEIVLTVWPEPDARYLDELEEKIVPYLEAAGAAGLEFDAESNWTARRVDSAHGFKSLAAAGDRLVEVFDSVRERVDARIEVTTFTMHAENSRSAVIAPHADRLLPQAYAVRSRASGDIEEGVKKIDWNGQYGPGRMQELTLRRAKDVIAVAKATPRPEGSISPWPSLSCGLAAYDQEWPGHTGEEAMRVSYDAAVLHAPREIRFWSSKWVIGVKANGYSSRFLKAIKAERVRH